jgi:hypothetical protein
MQWKEILIDINNRERALAVTPTIQKLKYLPLKESIKRGGGNKITYYLLQLSGTIISFVL